MIRYSLGPGQMAVVDSEDAEIEAVSLGSTVALCARDDEHGVAGMAVFAIPKLPQGMDVSQDHPVMGVVSGLPIFIKGLQEAGAQVASLGFWIVGASQFMSAPPDLSLGSQLYSLIKGTLEKNGLKIRNEAVGGVRNRGVSISLKGDGPVIRTGRREEGLS